MDSVDIAVIGGGMAGATLAAGLQAAGWDVALVERAQPPEEPEYPAEPGRVTALGEGSRRILERLGLWDRSAHWSCPITTIEVTEGERRGRVVLEAREAGVPALGYVVPNRVLVGSAWHAVRASRRVAVRAPVELAGLEWDPEGVTIRLAGEGGNSSIRASLVVGADSEHSWVRKASGIGTRGRHHNRYALVGTVESEVDLAGQAFERFLPEGPLAFLPLGGNRASIVWTLTPSAAEAAELSERAFLARLRERFGPALGELRSVRGLGVKPLELALARQFVGPRTALVGNAAHLLHPVGGQGFNLALRDVDALARELGGAGERGWEAGSPFALERYQRGRRLDTARVAALTEGLVGTFSGARGPRVGFRQLGLRLMGHSRLLRRAMMRQAMALSPGDEEGSEPRNPVRPQ